METTNSNNQEDGNIVSKNIEEEYERKKAKYKERTFKGLKIFGMVIGGVLLAVLFGFLFGIVVQKLWNWLMPDIFGLKTITYWQAVGMVVLSKLLFGGFGGGHDHSHGHKRKEKLGGGCGCGGHEKNGEKVSIKSVIKSEIEKELDKEFEKECRKKGC